MSYRADGSTVEIENTVEASEAWISVRLAEEQYPDMSPPKWRPSIYMPRWASRITLEVTSVRVERLQAITEEGAKAEGMGSVLEGTACPRYLQAFEKLWESINGNRPGCDWASSPWVWVVQFKRVQP